jgi:hypothetical protein
LFLVVSILTAAAGYGIAPKLTASANEGDGVRTTSIGTCEASPIGSIEVESTGGTPGPSGYGTLGEAFAAINAGVHTGDVAIDVCGDTTEPATAQLFASGTGHSSYTSVTMRPAGGPRLIEGSVTGALIKLAGADNVLIDGRPSGIGNARDLTVRNNSGNTSTAAFWITSLGPGEGATANTIRNLNIAAGIPQNTSSNLTYGIIMAGDNSSMIVTSNGNDNDNNSFIANRITRVRYGIVTRGVPTNLAIGTIVRDNVIGPDAFGPDEIGKVGILMQADDGAVISHNTVQFVGGLLANTPSGTDRIGIGIGQEAWTTTPATIASKNYIVSDNVIHDVVDERTSSAVGLVLATTGGGSPTNNLVANNFIYNIRSNGASAHQTVGIAISGGHSDQVVFNSISLTGDVNTSAASAPVVGYGSGIRIGVANSTAHQNLTLKNNSVLVDLRSSRTANVRFYAISGSSPAYSFGSGGEDFNNYYIDPANPQSQTGGLGTNQGNSLTTQFSTLADWKLAYQVSQDANSIQADPLYTSTTADLHIAAGSPNVDQGTPAAGIVADIDGEMRTTTPDIGADEFQLANTLPTVEFSTSSFGGPEGSAITVEVSRSGDLSNPSDVSYRTVSGNAVEGTCGTFGKDYENSAGTVHFSAGESIGTFSVTLCSDLLRENPAETFGLELSGAVGAVLGVRTGATASIYDAATQFTNFAPLTIPAGGTSTPYGTSIVVSGMTQPVQDVRLTLFGLTQAVPDDLDVLLVGPQGESFAAFAYAGGASGLSGVTLTLEDAASVHLADGGPIAEGVNYKPTACGQVLEFPAPAPPLPYPHAACTDSGQGSTFANVFAGADANGTWTLYVRDHGSAGVAAFGAAGSLGGWGIQLLTPTAAAASVSGRVVTDGGIGIRNAAVTVSGSGLARPRTVYTGSFGAYSLDGLSVGQAYAVTVQAKHFRFAKPSRIVSLHEDLTGIDFIAEP